MQPDVHRIRNIFLKIFTVPALLLLGITFLMYQFDTDNSLKLTRQNAELNIANQKDLFEQEFSVVVGDLIFLSRLHSMNDLLHNAEDRITQQVLAKDFKLFANQKRKYDQVRYLDRHGMEVVRINYRNGKADVVERKKLQSKKGRYYFKDSLDLDRGEVFVSPVTLNVEHGEIERPLKPTIHLATPVFDDQGNRHGMVILNYLASKLFSLIDKAGVATGSTSMMLNHAGYWLKGETAEDEWGFMLEDRKDKTMAKVYPGAWSKMEHEKQGQFMISEGIFTFTTVTQNQIESTEERGSNDNFNQLQSWKIVLHTPASVLRENRWKILPRYIVPDLVFLFIWAAACFFLSRGRASREEAQRKLDDKDEHMRNIINIAFDSIITINERGIIKSFNPAASHLFGYLENEVIGQKVNILMPSPDREYHDIYLQNFIETGKGKIIQRPSVVMGMKRDGEKFPMVICIGAKKIDNSWMFTGICRDNTEHEEAQRMLQEMAIHDGLTGIHNRRYFNEQLISEFNRAKRYGKDLSVVILDIDYFKELNDEKGHQMGDAYLVQFAELLKQTSRSIDVVARYGGDEFVLLLPLIDSSQALIMAERIRVGVTKLDIAQQDESIKNTISVGVAALLDGQIESSDELIRNADQALYHAKRMGRNQCARMTATYDEPEKKPQPTTEEQASTKEEEQEPTKEEEQTPTKE